MFRPSSKFSKLEFINFYTFFKFHFQLFADFSILLVQYFKLLWILKRLIFVETLEFLKNEGLRK